LVQYVVARIDVRYSKLGSGSLLCR
jgi:hypothetical protein